MGTSSAFGGPSNNTPLVPTWLEPGVPTLPAAPEGAAPDSDSQHTGTPIGSATVPSNPQPIQPPTPAKRFSFARANLSHFAATGGRDRASLGRSVSHYISTSSGGARTAAQRMGSSRATGRHLLSFLSEAVTRGAHEALRTLNLEQLVGQPIEDIFLGLADYICPDGGTIDEGISREAFIETIADLAENGITDFDGLTADQMQTVFELYATHAIEARLCNDVGMRIITLPVDVHEAEQVEEQLLDFIRRSVSDALTIARGAIQTLTVENVVAFVDGVYERAFQILQILGDREAAAV